MDSHAIEQFLHLARSLHFGRTSSACNLSPSALSRSIQRLEEELGCKLLERDNRTVRLTDDGRTFREFAEAFKTDWQALRERLSSNRKTISGTLRFYCSVTASYTFLPVILSKFRTAFPSIHIRLETGAAAIAVERILRREVDVAVAAKPDNLPGGLLFAPLATIPLVFIRAKGMRDTRRKTGITSSTPLVLPEHGLARKRVDAWLRMKGVRPNIYAEVAGNEAIIAMASMGCGTGIAPKLVLENSPLRTHVAILDISPALKPYEVGLCASKRRLQSPVVKTFWDYAAAQIAASPSPATA
ncbi:MAG: HTH-type transcriptional activator IlvY [Verrucomicrobiae bacterium]|nr:HTH-type transcriptional activator IlvY [Verrucomicrobiae bacterium]